MLDKKHGEKCLTFLIYCKIEIGIEIGIGIENNTLKFLGRTLLNMEEIAKRPVLPATQSVLVSTPGF